MVMSRGLHSLLLCSLPLAVMSLTCYKCEFPAMSPLDCVMLPQDCSPGQRCLYITATVLRGVVLQDKSCAAPSQCELSDEHTAGPYLSYTKKCCDTNLCNAADLSIATCWRGLVLVFGMVVFFLF
ncbi:sperm acrosome membrane-associated protein 4-like [Brachyhypopomus gauderio]|uniref:sperm acrosome membrane-associated protein 4-like n=1 Tax=Brachyhypopomus gauderio TaxID=698409 RepID=UPI004041FBF6